eukprot:gnl/TRDRNA2_/TRDRNA2_167408_c0_seq5.p2 gnl/TRDRNA2_/TRDRNA2_167408_c0~~gnl/TRDRNA2_/TRDRNA2_167408_c0_seq5.p2  ORF type:complete len:225 (+),score=51.69 gnl/TRDRNA2_/TRDRNA2_167408_c0_seq5:122-796(+)
MLCDNLALWKHRCKHCFFATTGGTDWEGPFELVGNLGPVYSLVFFFYVSFCHFALFNVITSVFVQHAMKIAQPDVNSLIFEHRRQEMVDTEIMKQFCYDMDVDHSGRISLEELQSCLHSDKAKTQLTMQGLDARDAEMFFKIVSWESQSPEVDIELFAETAMKMKGYANAMDIQILLFKAKLAERKQFQFEQTVKQGFIHLENLLRRHGSVDGCSSSCPPASAL